MKCGKEVPAESEEKPGEEEGGGKGQEGPGPGQVNHRGEEVLQVPRPPNVNSPGLAARD